MAETGDFSVKLTSQARENSPPATALLMHQDIDNSDDVYLLRTREHPRLSLVSIPVTPKNYLSWSQNVVTYLKSKGKEVFIFRTLPRPKFGEPNYVRWGKIDAMI